MILPSWSNKESVILKKESGIGFVGILQIAFIVLKLCKVIDWSWWLVLAPLWLDIAVIIVVSLIISILTN